MAKTIAFGSHRSGLKRALGRKDRVRLFVVAVANLDMVPPISASVWLLSQTGSWRRLAPILAA